jgi:hypothetical protein
MRRGRSIGPATICNSGRNRRIGCARHHLAPILIELEARLTMEGANIWTAKVAPKC